MGAALLGLAGWSCSRHDVSERCAAALGAAARGSVPEIEVQGTRVIFPGVQLVVESRVEHEETQGGKSLVGIAVSVSPPTGRPFTAGSVGIGRDRADAVSTAIDEWVQLSGVAIVRGVVLRDKAAQRFVLPGVVAYPGETGFRGADKVSWSPEHHERLVRLMAPSLAALPSHSLHSVSLTVGVRPGQPVQGDCRIDGNPSTELADLMGRFDWPVGSYMFKQYYVVEVAGRAAQQGV